MKDHERVLRATIRRYVDRIGADWYRITRDGEVHIYGTMPNTNRAGWYLFANSTDHALQLIRTGG